MERVPTKGKWGRKCDLPVVPFGEVVLFRLPEVANDRHQALEERWSQGIWLGHARGIGEILVSDAHGVRHVWAIRTLIEDQQWDGERLKGIKGSPNTWKLDAGPGKALLE